MMLLLLRRRVKNILMPLARFANVFGRPGEGVHAPRLFGVAAVDLLLTLLTALMLPVLLLPPAQRTLAAFAASFAALMLLAVGTHWLFGVRTALNRALGLAGGAAAAPH